jgi:hypothetical protein
LQLFRAVAWELAKTGKSDVRHDTHFVLQSARSVMRTCQVQDDENTFAGMLEIALRSTILHGKNANAIVDERNAGLDIVFTMVQQTPHSVLAQPQSIQKVVHLCIQCGRVDKGLQYMASLRAKGISIPVHCFNEVSIITSNTSRHANSCLGSCFSAFTILWTWQLQASCNISSANARDGSATWYVHFNIRACLLCF